jgi:hypothetical protein
MIPAMLSGGLLALLCLLPAATAAAEPLRSSLSADDRVLLNAGSMDYNGCLQERAITHIDELDDVRLIAGRAVEDCSDIMEGLRQKLDERHIDPDYYAGILRHIKTRAIRKIMPNIMMYKANAGGGPPPASEHSK